LPPLTKTPSAHIITVTPEVVTPPPVISPSPLPVPSPQVQVIVTKKKKKMKAVITYVSSSGYDSAGNAPQIITVTQRIKEKKN
jgi:hypothetical protein